MAGLRLLVVAFGLVVSRLLVCCIQMPNRACGNRQALEQCVGVHGQCATETGAVGVALTCVDGSALIEP